MSNKLKNQIYIDIFQPSAQKIGISFHNVTDKLANNWCKRLDKVKVLTQKSKIMMESNNDIL